MIQEFVDRYMARKDSLRARFAEAHPDSYSDIVRGVIETINPDNAYGAPDPKRIHEIDDGDYQGTLVFVIASTGYQPDDYWYVRVSYGSCSGCDTLEAIRDYEDGQPSDQQVDDYMALALHIVQGLKAMSDTTEGDND